MLLGVLLARIIPNGIIGIVLVSILFSFIAFGKKSPGLLLLTFTIPIIIAAFITPECITPLHSRNREYYGSGFHVCKYLSTRTSSIQFMRVLGECILIGSVILFSHPSSIVLKTIGIVLGITLVLIEMLFVHPVPLLEREYTQWKLKINPLD